jgi:Xaa-Pro aminopeptidase
MVSTLISNFYNILYLTGFKGLNPYEREAWVVVTPGKIYLITDGRHDTSNLESSPPAGEIEFKILTPKKNLTQYLNEIIKKEKINTLEFEADDLTVGEFKRIKKNLKGIQFIPTKNSVTKKREIKTNPEIEKIKKACLIADKCLEEIVKTIKIGMTEGEIAFKIEFWFKKNGHDISFYPIVAVDENSAIPHYDTKANGSKKIKKGSVLLIDYGAKYQDYCSDTTRIFFAGKPNNEKLIRYNYLLKIQETTIKKFKEFKKLKELDDYCRDQIRRLELPSFPHSLGHGIGLEVHEGPRVSQHSKDEITSGQVFTIEPGIYFPGRYGFRIEDTIAVGENSDPQILTKFLRAPYFLPAV